MVGVGVAGARSIAGRRRVHVGLQVQAADGPTIQFSLIPFHAIRFTIRPVAERGRTRSAPSIGQWATMTS